MNSFIVTTTTQGNTRTQIWNSDRPIALGHPFRWILERSEHGVRIRDLSAPTNHIETGRAQELSHDQLQTGANLELQGTQFTIRPAAHLAPAFEAQASGTSLRIYRCAGQWVMDSQSLGASLHARHHKKTAFSLKKAGEHYSIISQVEGLKLSTGSEIRTLKAGETLALSTTDLARCTIALPPAEDEAGLSWRFGLVSVPEYADVEPGQKRKLAGLDLLNFEDGVAFKKALRHTAVGLMAFALLSWFWPKPKVDPRELIPPQFTKIVMSQPKQAAPAAASASSEAAAIAKNAPEKVQKSAVVQAFRAHALNNAVSGLLKGGMTKLMAQSDFVSGNKSIEARTLFNGKTEAFSNTSPTGGTQGNKVVQIASLGGGPGGKGGTGVGYGKGQKAGIDGQGKGFVPFIQADSNGSVVDEGLTKDEVGEVIHRHMSEVRYCYESAMIRTPDLEGKLMTAFTINGKGVIKSAEVRSSTLPDPRLDDCIIRRLTTWQFPKPRGGVDVAVSYPFIFKTLGR